MTKQSAGLILYRRRNGVVEFLLVHPGGPFWKKKDAGAWTIPKGEIQPDETPLAAARREFEEELGLAPAGDWMELQPIRQKGGKTVHAWGFEGDFDPANLRSNTFTMEWPPRSATMREFPEVDKARFFHLSAAREKINPAQIALLEELQARVENL